MLGWEKGVEVGISAICCGSLEVEVDKAIIGVFWSVLALFLFMKDTNFSNPRGDGGNPLSGMICGISHCMVHSMWDMGTEFLSPIGPSKWISVVGNRHCCAGTSIIWMSGIRGRPKS